MEAPFDAYAQDVDYKFILNAEMKYHLENGSEDQQIEAMEGFIQQIESLLTNEDFLSMYFEEPGLGRVYAKLEDFDNTINIKFGISDIDKRKELILDDLIADIKEFMASLDINLDGIPITGIGGNLDPRDDTEPATIYLKGDYMKDQSDIIVEIEKEPKTESFDSIDKRLISEGKLFFNNFVKNCSKEIIMNDDGIVELYETTGLTKNKLTKSFPFSRLALIRECKSIVQEGYILKELQIKDSDGNPIDTEEEIKNLEQTKDELDQIKQTKDEIEDEVDELFEESDSLKESNEIEDFENTPYTQQEFSYNDARELTDSILADNLTNNQVKFLENLGYSLEDICLGFIDLFITLDMQEELCLDLYSYIQGLIANKNKEDLS